MEQDSPLTDLSSSQFQSGEAWFVDLGMVGKLRYALVLAAQTDARLALASVVLITKQFEGTPYEVPLPRVP